jgi:hypothetical protein
MPGLQRFSKAHAVVGAARCGCVGIPRCCSIHAWRSPTRVRHPETIS